MQLTHYNSKFKIHNFPITLVCDHVTNAPNIGSLFRIADAFGIEQVIWCGKTVPLGRKMTKTSRSTEKSVNYKIEHSALKVVKEFKQKNHHIIALEITNTSKPIHEFKCSTKNAIVLVVGDENFGISEAILKEADTIIHIDMFGNNSSMNVVQATNIALYELTKQLRGF